MKKYKMKDKCFVDKECIKIHQRSWLHLLPSILIYSDGNEGSWCQISAIEIAWFYWEVEIYFN